MGRQNIRKNNGRKRLKESRKERVVTKNVSSIQK